MLTNQKSIYYLRLFLDLLLLNITFIASAVVAQSLHILIDRNYMFILLMALNFLWYFASNVVNFYEDFNARFFSFQFTNIIKIVITQAIASIFFIFLVKEDLFTRNFIIYYSLLLMFLISIRIIAVRYIIRKVKGREKNLRNIVIVGAGEAGKNFYESIIKNTELGYNLIGFLDDQKSNEPLIIGEISKLDYVLSANKVDEVVAALSLQAADELDEIIKVCNRHGVRVHIVPDYFRYVSKKYRISMIGDVPIITVRDEPLSEAHWRIVKRTFDIFFSLFVIVFFLSWFFPLTFLLIKLSSKGKALFAQERVGVEGKHFLCYKFRTMKSGSEKIKYQPTVEKDSRVTKIGAFLRRSNLDETPQFYNVLKGDMSVVGPRPHSVEYDNIYKEMVHELRLRGWVKPGITGWAQIHGYRGDVLDYEENKIRTNKRIEFDIWYIENWSIWLDIQIILLTAWQMFKGDTKGV